MLTKLNRFRIWLLSRPALVALLFLPFFEPAIAIQYPAADWTYVVLKGVSMLCLAACFLARPLVSPVTIAVGVYQVLVLIILFVERSGGSVYRWVFDTASIAAICLLVEQAADGDARAAVSGIFYVLGTLCVINLITVVLFPGGMSYTDKEDWYFLGLDNSHAFYIIPLLPAAALYAWNRRWPRWVQLGMMVLFSLSLYITWTVTGMMAATVFIILFLLSWVKGSSRVCNIGVYYAGILLVFLLFVVFRVTDRFAFFIQDVLHKSLTLSGRLPLWQTALDCVKASPLLGHGLVTPDRMVELAGEINCHNIFLQCLFDTGLVGTAVYVTALCLLIRPLMKLRSNYAGYMLAAGVCAFLLLLQAESLVWESEFYTLLILAANGEKVAAALDPDGKDALGGSTV